MRMIVFISFASVLTRTAYKRRQSATLYAESAKNLVFNAGSNVANNIMVGVKNFFTDLFAPFR